MIKFRNLIQAAGLPLGRCRGSYNSVAINLGANRLAALLLLLYELCPIPFATISKSVDVWCSQSRKSPNGRQLATHAYRLDQNITVGWIVYFLLLCVKGVKRQWDGLLKRKMMWVVVRIPENFSVERFSENHNFEFIIMQRNLLHFASVLYTVCLYIYHKQHGKRPTLLVSCVYL
jgi:hypothetical protein